ncbi:thioredoxin family protein [Rhodopirellula sp. JC639]|uniref:thioredoxin family protein n=1 Tax=Stieleria mannarensis TaxID=2755585 RepID=UPI0015FEDD43|nr:thioredoxin family protein [Rhodopirellula sp. JC639]
MRTGNPPATRIAGGFATAMAIVISSAALVARGDDAQTVPDWIRGSGNALEMRLSGRVKRKDGQAVDEATVRISIDFNQQHFETVTPEVRDGAFEVWIPVNKYRWYSVKIDASCQDGARAHETIVRNQLRQRVIDGVVLQVERPQRSVEFQLLHQGSAVANAKLRVQLNNGAYLRTQAEADGVATILLLPHEELIAVTAWSQDQLIGGYQFSRKPIRDPKADHHEIEMVTCRPCPVTLRDGEEKPIKDVPLQLQVATPQPHVNFFGIPDDVTLITDENGVAIYPYFPEIDDVYCYAELHSEDWRRVESKYEQEAFVVTAQKAVERHTVEGAVSGGDVFLGGFVVRLGSFQAEEEGRIDYVYAVTDADGRFSVDVLPDATYCAYVSDERWVTPSIDLIPYESVTQKHNSPNLNVAKGIPVQVRLTSGSDRKPIAKMRVHLGSNHSFTWQENGKPRSGVLGRRSDGYTDDEGRVTVFVPAGDLEASVYSTDWRANQKIVVEAGTKNEIHLHRAVDKAVAVEGKIVPWQDDQELKDATIQIGAIDGQTGEEFALKADDEGNFRFETKATKLAAVAVSADKRFAGSALIQDLDGTASIRLYPTKSFHGQILDGEGQPVASHPVRASIRVSDGSRFGNGFPTTFYLPRIERLTDANGRYRFESLPCKTEISIRADTLDHQPNQFRSIDTVYLLPDEERREVITRLGKNEASGDKKTLAERFQITQRDCRLNNFRQMVILADDENEVVVDFIEKSLLDYSQQKKITTFMQLRVVPSDLADPVDQSFVERMNWPAVKDGHVFICAYDADENELGRAVLNVADARSASIADEFIQQHATPQQDAQQKWDKAFKTAQASDRRVWIRTGQRYCGPCFRLSRWIDDHRDVLEKDFVLVKVDDVRDRHGFKVAKRLTQGRPVGVPFHSMFDADGNLITDSYGPIGNIGSMSGVEGKRHFRTMLDAACVNITPDEIERLIESLDD